MSAEVIEIQNDSPTEAVDDVLSVLSFQQEGERPTIVAWKPDIFPECRGLLRPTDPALKDSASYRSASRFLETARREKAPVAFAIDGADLLVRIEAQSSGTSGFVAVLDDECFRHFLDAAFPAAQLPPALRRVLALQLAGIGLKEGAIRDDRSVETRKRQAQQLRARFESGDLSAIGRQVAAALALALADHVHPPGKIVGKTLAGYIKRYLPGNVRAYGLTSADGDTSTAVLDMGPLDGRPVLVLHPMALPDIRIDEIETCERLGLRLIWPLRHGSLDPGASALPHDEHMRRAVEGADLAIGAITHETVPILAFAAASKVGLALAHKKKNRISALHVAGVCVREGRPEAGPRRLARGVLALAAQKPELLDPVLRHLEAKLRKPGALARMLERQFADSPADAAIIARDLGGIYGCDRFADSLLDSAASARHDFLFQADMGWNRAPANLPIHLHHGAQDAIHPLPLIEALVRSLPNATLHILPDAGQLIWYEHLQSVLERLVGE